MQKTAFPEEAYLRVNPDVAAAVGRGEFRSGEHHYRLFGRNEGRLVPCYASSFDRPVFFCHIPKTAGTSVRAALEACFPPHQIMPDAYMMARNAGRYPPLAHFTGLLSAQKDAVRLLRGHYPMAAAELLPGCLRIVVLRDPVARTVSHLQHLIRQGVRSEKEIYASLDAGQCVVPDNLQVRMLTDRARTEVRATRGPRAKRMLPAAATLEAAFRTLEQTDIVGISEDLPHFVAEVSERLGVALQITHHNRSQHKLRLSQAQLDVVRRHNELDAALYEKAVATLR